jgi:hypothetical protein
MTLDQLLQGDANVEDLRTMWLVFDASIAQSLKDAQPVYQHQVAPITLTDGRHVLCADLLTEKDGIYAPTFTSLDPTAFPQVEVIHESAIGELFQTHTSEEE